VTGVAVDARWVAEASSLVLAAMEEHRSTWQMWHVRAEAQRHVRGVEVPAERVSTLVDLLPDEVLHTRSVPVAPPDDGIEELEVLRRFDGSSVYTLAGPTSTHRQESLTPRSLVATAGRRDGATVDDTAIDLAFSRWRRTAPP
jgi:hypothetical protein